MDIVVIFVVLLIVALVFKKPSNVFIFFGIIDVSLRIIDYIGNHTSSDINNFVNKVFPDSIPAIINNYLSEGTLQQIFMWGYILLMILFVYCVFRMLLHRL